MADYPPPPVFYGKQSSRRRLPTSSRPKPRWWWQQRLLPSQHPRAIIPNSTFYSVNERKKICSLILINHFKWQLYAILITFKNNIICILFYIQKVEFINFYFNTKQQKTEMATLVAMKNERWLCMRSYISNVYYCCSMLSTTTINVCHPEGGRLSYRVLICLATA